MTAGTRPPKPHRGSTPVGPIRGNQVRPIPGNRVGSIRENSAIYFGLPRLFFNFLAAFDRLVVRPRIGTLAVVARGLHEGPSSSISQCVDVLLTQRPATEMQSRPPAQPRNVIQASESDTDDGR